MSGDIIDEVTRLKQRSGGELQVHGSCGAAHALHEAGLVDEYRLLVFQVSVGKGKRLFSDGAPATGFDLVDSRITGTGGVYPALQPGPFEVRRVEVADGKDTIRGT